MIQVELSILKKYLPEKELNKIIEAKARSISRNFKYKVEIDPYINGLKYYKARGFIYIGETNNKITVSKGLGTSKVIYEKYKTFSIKEIHEIIKEDMKNLCLEKAIKVLKS